MVANAGIHVEEFEDAIQWRRLRGSIVSIFILEKCPSFQKINIKTRYNVLFATVLYNFEQRTKLFVKLKQRPFHTVSRNSRELFYDGTRIIFLQECILQKNTNFGLVIQIINGVLV